MKSENEILFYNIPKTTDLNYFIALIDYSHCNGPNFSCRNHQRIVTRRLVQYWERILVAPVEGKFFQIHVISLDKNFRSNELKKLEEEFKLSFTSPDLLTRAVYNECIRFTLSTRISEKWNSIQNYFIKNQNFLKSNEAEDCVYLEFIVTDDYLTVYIKTLQIKISILNLIEMNVDLQTLNKNGFVNIRQNVFILPYLKPAIATTVYLKLPDSCPFRDYSDIKNYWKTLYGYNLPINDDEIVYVEVTFGRSNLTYIYPIICVCHCKPICFPSKDALRLMQEFSEVFKKEISTISGFFSQPSMTEKETYSPTRNLQMASELEIIKINQMNLSTLVTISKYDPSNEKVNCNQGDDVSKKKCNTKNSEPTYRQTRLAFIPYSSVTSNEKFMCTSKLTFTNKNFSVPDKSCSAKKPKTSSTKTENLHRNENFSAHDPVKNDKMKSFKNNHEIETLARMKILKTVNLSVLRRFCKDNDIPLKSKEKKERVLQKVYDYFAITKAKTLVLN